MLTQLGGVASKLFLHRAKTLRRGGGVFAAFYFDCRRFVNRALIFVHAERLRQQPVAAFTVNLAAQRLRERRDPALVNAASPPSPGAVVPSEMLPVRLWGLQGQVYA